MALLRKLVAAAAFLAAACPGTALAVSTPRLKIAFDHGVVLGGSTALHAELTLRRSTTSSPVVVVQLLYPDSLGDVVGGLGQATCSRPATDFAEVIVGGNFGGRLAGCPGNAVLGYGTAQAEVRFIDGSRVSEYATVTLLAGPIDASGLGVVVFVDAYRPFMGKLAYGGELEASRPPFGGVLTVRIPPIPALAGIAVVALDSMHMDLGSSQITYVTHHAGRTVAFHPDGIDLPRRCPVRGFHFLARLTFADGSVSRAQATVPCAKLQSATA